MCLYTRDKQPRIAKSDIVALKYLFKMENEKFITPCQGTPVEMGEVLVASPSEPDTTFKFNDYLGRKIYTIGRGAIHATLLGGPHYGNYCAKAIIPKGTKYWIDRFGTEIAAEKMLITKGVGIYDVFNDSLAREILAYAPEVNGIRIGDYQMIDDSFIHPKKSIAKTKVRGIVCGFYEDSKPIICALEMFGENWDSQDYSKIGGHTDLQIAKKLFNGKEITRTYIQLTDYLRTQGLNCARFGAFERCINYRKDKGEEWFFGALGETMAMLDNTIYLNAAHKITGLGFIIYTDYWYWSCSSLSFSRSCICGLSKYIVNYDWSLKTSIRRVVPFYASTK